MMKVLNLVLFLIWSLAAWAQDIYTDAEAASKAQSLVKDAYALHARVAEVCDDASATGLLYEAAEDALQKLHGWPDQKSQALASYDSCRQSMVDVQSYAYTCAQDGYKGKAVTYMQRRWTEDTTSCDEAIRASGLSGSGRN